MARSREQILAQRTLFRGEHRKELAAKQRSYYVEHLAARRAYDRARWPSRPKRSWDSGAGRAYYLANRDRQIDKARSWQRANPEKTKENRHRDRVRRSQADTCSHPACLALGPIVVAWQANPHTCYLCGGPVEWGRNLHMDHVQPLARGGAHCADNLRPACSGCNTAKWALSLDEFLARRVVQ